MCIRDRGEATADELWFVEHPPVYTLGLCVVPPPAAVTPASVASPAGSVAAASDDALGRPRVPVAVIVTLALSSSMAFVLARVALDFRGTDTHGLKAFDRATVLPIVRSCVVDRDLFASELVIRAGRAGLRIIEIPIQLAEKRAPAINLVRRVPRVLSGLARLTYAIRFGGRIDS